MKKVFLLLCVHVSLCAMDNRLNDALQYDYVDKFKEYMQAMNGDAESASEGYEGQLIQHVVKLNINDCVPEIKRETFLHAAVANKASKVAQYLIQEGAQVNVCNQQGFTPVSLAAHNGQEGVIKLLLEHNANPSTPNQWGNGPLHIVADSKECTELLLKAGAYIPACNDKGETPLDMARQKNKLAVVFALEEALQKKESMDAYGSDIG